jgi:transcriptional regulator with XRE-family HTH domain
MLTTDPQPTEATLHHMLRTELKARQWSISQLALQVGVKPGVASRWVTCDASKRVAPRPDKCVALARVLELDISSVFAAAGYLPLDGSNPGFRLTDDEEKREAEIRQLKRRFETVLRQASPGMWPLVLSVANVTLDQLAALLSRAEQFFRNFE